MHACMQPSFHPSIHPSSSQFSCPGLLEDLERSHHGAQGAGQEVPRVGWQKNDSFKLELFANSLNKHFDWFASAGVVYRNWNQKTGVCDEVCDPNWRNCFRKQMDA